MITKDIDTREDMTSDEIISDNIRNVNSDFDDLQSLKKNQSLNLSSQSHARYNNFRVKEA